jgi:hypothetical protein
MSAPDLNNPDHLSQVLRMLSANSTETVKQGEQLLKPFNKDPICLSAYMTQITSCPDLVCRHQAALMLKKCISRHFEKFPEANRDSLKATILNIFVNETSKPIQNALAGYI